MISAEEARTKSDSKKQGTFLQRAEKAINQAVNKGEYSAVLEDICLSSFPESALKELEKLGYCVSEYKTTYYNDTVHCVKISWGK